MFIRSPIYLLTKPVVSPEIHSACEDCSSKCGSKVLCITIDCTVSKAPLGCPLQVTVCPSCDSFWAAMNQDALRIPPIILGHQTTVVRESHVQPANISNDETTGGRVMRRYVEVGYSAEAAVPDCRCGLPAALKSVTKESQNRGRKFFCCSRPHSDSRNCKFFQFCDEEESGRPMRAASIPKRDTVCSRCMKPGHFARSCPEKNH